jgi:6-phosphogluconolactonase
VEAAVSPDRAAEVRVFADVGTLSRAAAESFVSLALSAGASRDRFAVALSGGTTPKRLYSLLASPPYRDRIDWTSLHVFWADERCVPWDHRDSNFKLAYDTLLSRVPLPPENVHRVCGEEEPECAAQEYEQELRSFFGPATFPVFDLILLGAGEDGHTASLFPGGATLRARTRLAVPVHFDAPKHSRVTLTLPVLNHAEKVLFLASGRVKAKVVHEILEDGNPYQYPAGMVRPVRGRVLWMVDRDAARLLTTPHSPYLTGH